MYKVIIIEDDPMVAMINEQYISKISNFEVVGKFRDGASALAFLEHNPVDLLILDVYLPKMDGFELLRQIRNHKAHVDAIIVTAANDKESLEEALHLGVVDYLVKPFTFDRFRLAFEKYLDQSTAFKNLENLNQTAIDHIIEHFTPKKSRAYPKGIQEKTMQLILSYLKANSGKWFTSDKIAEETEITSVTVRRYMNYLSRSNCVTSEMNYETGGRPCVKYRFSE